MRVYHRPFVSGETLTLVYPVLAPLLNTVPNHLEDNVRVYNSLIALDVVNALRKLAEAPTEESDKIQ